MCFACNVLMCINPWIIQTVALLLLFASIRPSKSLDLSYSSDFSDFSDLGTPAQEDSEGCIPPRIDEERLRVHPHAFPKDEGGMKIPQGTFVLNNVCLKQVTKVTHRQQHACMALVSHH